MREEMMIRVAIFFCKRRVYTNIKKVQEVQEVQEVQKVQKVQIEQFLNKNPPAIAEGSEIYKE